MHSSETNSSHSHGTDETQAGTRKGSGAGRATLLAFAVLLTAGSLIVVPRPTYPQILPLPVIDQSRVAQLEGAELERAAAVADGSLGRASRSIGEQVRRIGRVLATEQQSPESRLAALRQEADVLARQPEGTLELLSLRALQAELFLLAVAGWNTSQPAPNEVLELGGPFAGFAAISWADGRGGLVVSRDQLRLFYRVYWGRLTGLSADAAFEPSVDEARRYYRTVLVHPPVTSADQMSQDLARLNYVQALGEVDSSYPSLLAQALLSLRLGQPEKAHRLLTLHLGQHPEGSWTAIARNARLFAAQAIPPGAP